MLQMFADEPIPRMDEADNPEEVQYEGSYQGTNRAALALTASI
jgi:hypothetical protein